MIQILKSKEKKEILEKLEDQYGISKIQGMLILVGKERIFLYQGSMNEEDIVNLEKVIYIERIGTYIAKIQENKIRLSIEGTHLLKNQITKNIFDLNEEQATEWMMGRELLFKDLNKKNNEPNIDVDNISNNKSEQSEPIDGWEGGNDLLQKNPYGYIVMRYNNDFLGTGKASQNKITNFIPKNRRLKEKN